MSPYRLRPPRGGLFFLAELNTTRIPDLLHLILTDLRGPNTRHPLPRHLSHNAAGRLQPPGGHGVGVMVGVGESVGVGVRVTVGVGVGSGSMTKTALPWSAGAG